MALIIKNLMVILQKLILYMEQHTIKMILENLQKIVIIHGFQNDSQEVMAEMASI